MEEFGSLWSYQEGMDELKLKLYHTNLELESLQMKAYEEIRKNKEYVKNLLNLLKIANQERDEARDQLQKLLNKLMPSSTTELPSVLTHGQPESPLVIIPAKANSSITESNSMSETYNHHSHGSSPVDSFFDAVSSPDFSNINVVDSGNMVFVNQHLVHNYSSGYVSPGLASLGKVKIDPDSEVIENLVKGKALPEKGKLLQAVMEAGPLLQTLIVAGPLPRWRNPPPLQPFKIPTVSIEGCKTEQISFKSAANASFGIQKTQSSSPYPVMSRGSSQACSASVISFCADPSSSSLSNPRLLTSCASFNNHIPEAKRQRFQ
ncbi:uncharacterized protein LOC122290813 [Carya illinoinensis]|uniref:TOX high mobility group box family member 4-A n=1 Tax=Carya illinoinensis TaxID=32201 RepID=A0A8T1NRT0_CARIL|nr:uncharacterized protein LOC122290813 [Carya illinoinensis]KAG6631567.1 hypothetical protein CIPAW_13G099700 [Carya illinoinensis]KAG6681543.1 hypothetical protein I3842_13G098800 [Carya illinoinensis]